MISRVTNIFKQSSIKRLFMILLGFKMGLNFLLSAIGYIFISEEAMNLLPFLEAMDYNPLFLFVLFVFIGPISEALVFQYFFIEISALFESQILLIIAFLLSAVSFAMLHSYSTFYMVSMFLMGLLYNAIYLGLKKHRKDIVPYLFIVFLHAANNFIAFNVMYWQYK
ncbi:MAG: CPBP family glutamic-type intramembrane protease [Flavobacteriaceae bacterium]|nr:CPBP family glutamic-type intramembrane protease [Flavobacteriaceae bacterium]